eukprot:11181779-Lingulodinium_polyedra.AAC.1
MPMPTMSRRKTENYQIDNVDDDTDSHGGYNENSNADGHGKGAAATAIVVTSMTTSLTTM